MPLDADIIPPKKMPTVYPKLTFIRAITQATSTSEIGVNIIRTLKFQTYRVLFYYLFTFQAVATVYIQLLVELSHISFIFHSP